MFRLPFTALCLAATFLGVSTASRATESTEDLAPCEGRLRHLVNDSPSLTLMAARGVVAGADSAYAAIFGERWHPSSGDHPARYPPTQVHEAVAWLCRAIDTLLAHEEQTVTRELETFVAVFRDLHVRVQLDEAFWSAVARTEGTAEFFANRREQVELLGPRFGETLSSGEVGSYRFSLVRVLAARPANERDVLIERLIAERLACIAEASSYVPPER